MTRRIQISRFAAYLVLAASAGCTKFGTDRFSFEVCDNKDNDGDRKVDEGFELGTSCDGAEQESGVIECAGPFAVRCRTSGDAIRARAKAEDSPLEVCDGKDNDANGSIDEGFSTGESCTGLGECGEGKLECAGPFAVRCNAATRATMERCDGKDNDCDGQVDEDYDVGRSCTTTAKCPGKTACSDGNQTCLGAAPSKEICDGVDNDCDGYVDLSTAGSRVLDACACVENPLSFGETPGNSSQPPTSCAGKPNTCPGTGNELAMTFCLDFTLPAPPPSPAPPAPYALCVSEARMNVQSLTTADSDRALTVRFTFRSTSTANARANLYYHIDRTLPDKKTTAVRRYFPLLAPGDAPGTYTKVFLPQHTCFLNDPATLCKGSESMCPGCRSGDTCGVAQGTDCKDLLFDSAQLQLAVEDNKAGTNRFEGEVVIHEIFGGPLVCE